MGEKQFMHGMHVCSKHKQEIMPNHLNYCSWVDVGKVELRIIHRAEVEEALRQRISRSPSPSKPQRISQLGCYPFQF